MMTKLQLCEDAEHLALTESRQAGKTPVISSGGQQ